MTVSFAFPISRVTSEDGANRWSGDASSKGMPGSPLSTLHGVPVLPCAVQKAIKEATGAAQEEHGQNLQCKMWEVRLDLSELVQNGNIKCGELYS